MRWPAGVWRRRFGRAAWPAWAAPACLLVATLLLAGLTAPPAAAATTLAVAGAYGGSYVPGHPVAVKVEVAADRLLRGRLEVTLADLTSVSLPVEVPGGSTKEFLVVVPGWQSFQLGGAVTVKARLREGSNDVAAGSAFLQSSVGQELVGLLPGALGGRGVPGPAPLSVDAGTARFAALGPAELAQAPASLGPVSTIAAAADELGRLPETTRGAVLTWVEQGGHLLVDADPGQTVEGLPGGWQPGQDGRAAAGRGEVRLTGGAIAAGRWPGLVEPTGWAGAGDPSARFGDGFVGQTLAAEAGLRVPRLGWLVAFLAVYVLVAGPLAFFVLRRRGHPELAWVVVPLVAILFTAGSYVGGRGLRDTTRQVDTSIVSTGATGSTATTWLGVFSAGGQTSRIRFGPGWLPGGSGPDGNLTRPASLALTADGAEASLPLDAGQFGIVPSSGPVGGEGRLEVTAVTAASGEASGRVKNTTPYALDEVAVFIGTAETLVGRLAPGEEAEWRVTDADLDFFRPMGGGGPAGLQVWGGFSGFAPDGAGVSDFSLWETARRLGGQEFLGPGEVVAAGWTRSFAPPVAVDDDDAGRGGRTLVLGRGRAAAQGGILDIRREVVRAPDFQNTSEFVVRFVTRDADAGGAVPDPSRLMLRGPLERVEVWLDGRWSEIRPDDAQDLRLKGSAEFRLPPGAVQGDVVHLRFPAFSSGIDDNGLFTLRMSP